MSRYTKTMSEALQDIHEMSMKKIHDDIKKMMGNIAHKVEMKGKKHFIQVDANDESDAQKAIKMHPEYIAGRMRIQPMNKEETELDEKFTKKDFRDNEDINHHTENGVEIVNMFGTSAEKMKMAGIAARHNMKGSISRKDQQDRDALVKKYYPKLKEEVEIDEMDMKYVLINMQGKVQGYASDKKDALDIAKRTKSTMHPIKKKISDKTLEKMNALQKTPKELKDLGIIEEVELNELNPRLMKNMDDDNLKSYYLAFARDPIKMAPQDREIFKALTPEIKKRKIKFSKSEQDLIKKAMKSAKNPNMYEEVELTEKVSKELALATLSMMKNQKFVKVAGDFTPEIYLSKSDRDKLSKKFGRLPRGFPSQSDGMTVVSMINFALGNKDGRDPYDTEDGDSKSPKLYNYDTGKVVGKPKTVGDAAKMAGLRLESIDEMAYKPGSFKDTRPQEKGAKAFDKLIQSGGIDKKTFQKAKQLYVQASDPKSRMKLRDFIYNMDTDPLEAVMDLIGRNDPETFVRMYPDADEGERLSTISFRHKQKRIKTEELDDEDIPKVKKIIGKLKKASGAHAGQAKDLQKAIDEKGKEMTEKLTDGNLSLKETVLKMWQEAVSPAQQAAIAISKKEKEKDEGNAFGAALQAAKEKGEKTFTVAGKEYSVKTEKLVGGQKKLDKDKDGDIDAKDFALLRKSKKENVEHERQRYLETKRGSLRDAVLKMWGEDAHSKKDDEEKKKNLTKEKKHGTNKMTDTGKEMTPVDMKPKMPKIKNEKNKV